MLVYKKDRNKWRNIYSVYGVSIYTTRYQMPLATGFSSQHNSSSSSNCKYFIKSSNYL